jgi:transcriptional regulator with XRE-family HTH domain
MLAHRAGISKSFLSDLENGKRSVGAETLLDVGRAIGVSLDYLMTGKAAEFDDIQDQIPPALARLAAEEGLSVRDALALLKMQQQLVSTRRGAGKRRARLDWREFYEAVKKFL